jgi:hypothetical protein
VRGAAGPALTGACGAVQLASVVTVIQGTIETVSLPEQVDIIISEWMGCAAPLAAPPAPGRAGGAACEPRRHARALAGCGPWGACLRLPRHGQRRLRRLRGARA